MRKPFCLTPQNHFLPHPSSPFFIIPHRHILQPAFQNRQQKHNHKEPPDARPEADEKIIQPMQNHRLQKIPDLEFLMEAAVHKKPAQTTAGRMKNIRSQQPTQNQRVQKSPVTIHRFLKIVQKINNRFKTSKRQTKQKR